MSPLKKIPLGTTLLFLVVLLVLTAALSLSIGSAQISLRGLWDAIFSDRSSIDSQILFSIRLPRVILAIALGGALAITGTILQGVFQNPLTEPYTLGISGGASLGVALNILLKLNSIFGVLTFPLFGFLGASVTVFFVYFSAARQRRGAESILLTGVMVSFICSSLVMLIMALADSNQLHSIIFWTMGSLTATSFPLILLTCVTSVLALIISYFFARPLNALMLGDEEAGTLGVDVQTTRKILFLFASLVTGICVSVSGIIGFVGLIIPHFIRILFGTDHRRVLVLSWLGGAIFLMACDTIARTILAPIELPVGVVTGIIGGILFIYAFNKKKQEF